MASSARVHLKETSEGVERLLEVEVTSDSASPDVVDDVTHRANELFDAAVASTTTTAPDEG